MLIYNGELDPRNWLEAEKNLRITPENTQIQVLKKGIQKILNRNWTQVYSNEESLC